MQVSEAVAGHIKCVHRPHRSLPTPGLIVCDDSDDVAIVSVAGGTYMTVCICEIHISVS